MSKLNERLLKDRFYLIYRVEVKDSGDYLNATIRYQIEGFDKLLEHFKKEVKSFSYRYEKIENGSYQFERIISKPIGINYFEFKELIKKELDNIEKFLNEIIEKNRETRENIELLNESEY